jgi:hypothetical protein
MGRNGLEVSPLHPSCHAATEVTVTTAGPAAGLTTTATGAGVLRQRQVTLFHALSGSADERDSKGQIAMDDVKLIV